METQRGTAVLFCHKERSGRIVEATGAWATSSTSGATVRTLLTMKEAAAYLGLQTATLYEWVSERKISFTKMGRLTKFDRRYLDKFIDQNTVKARVTHGTN